MSAGGASERGFGGVVGRTAEDSRPWWPDPPRPPQGSPNIVLIVFDDVGFSDFGCYGSEISTPTLDGLAASGVRYTGFHTTALCSPTRACLLTGRNHHSVGMAGLADWDLGFPGVRGRISPSAATLAEMLRPHGYSSYAVGKWHLTPSAQTSAAGPFDQWPTQRGFDRFYGFLGGETSQWHPELVGDNHHLPTPDEAGYHLTEDLVDRAISELDAQIALAPDRPFFCYLALGACHAPHHVAREYIDRYEPVFAKGWDQTRADRLDRQKAMGLVPSATELPPRNDGVRPWEDLGDDERRVYVRLQAAYAGMLEHADQHLGRLVAFLEDAGRREDTLVAVLSDNGASQEGSPFGTVNALRYFNRVRDDLATNLAHIDEIGEAHLNNNYPQGWAMAGNTPLKRYKQNTHGGGVRDPLIVSWPARITDGGGIRHQFHHVSDLAPTILELVGIDAPDEVNGHPQLPIEGTSLAYTFDAADAASLKGTQYFEMLGSRGIWHEGWKAVAWHRPGTSFDEDRWELYHLEEDFAECNDLAATQPERLAALIERWWVEAGSHQVLPLRDPLAGLWSREGPASLRDRYVLHATPERIPTDVAPDVRDRSYSITAVVEFANATEGVLVAHGDACGGYALYVKDGHLVHELNVVGDHHVLRSAEPLEAGKRSLAYRFERSGPYAGTGSLWVDGRQVGELEVAHTQPGLLSFIGLEVGRAPLPAVGGFVAPFGFTGVIDHVTFELDHDQGPDGGAALRDALRRQ